MNIPTATATERLFAHLWRGGQHSYYWTPDPYNRSQWFSINGHIPDHPTAGNVYFGVNPVCQIPPTNSKNETKTPEFVRSQIAYIAAVNALFGEFDIKDFGSESAINEHLKRFPPASVVIHSGGGYHCYWLLKEPFIITSEADRQRAKNSQYAWVDYVGSDKDAKDLARVLRVPGTMNCKPAYAPNFPTVEIIKADFDLLYTLTYLDKQSQPKAEAPKAKTQSSAARPKSDDLQTAQSCLARLAPWRCENYQEWINVGMSLSALGSAGLPLWDSWSRQNGKYKPGECEKKWPTFTPDSGLTLGSLVHWANEDDPQPVTKSAESTQEKPQAKKRSKHPKSTEYIETLKGLGYTFSLSDLDETLFINGQPATDALEAKIKTQMRDLGYRYVNVMRDAYIAHSLDNKFNPIRGYLRALKWDGTERLDRLIDHFTDTKATKEHSAPLFGLWLKKWMVGAIAKVETGHQNPMLVLVSRIRHTPEGKQAGQGIGKSYFCKWLCSGLPDYFLSSEINPHDKDYKKRTLNHFIWEVDELGSTTRKAEVDALKAFITMPVVTIRPSYGRNDIKKRPMVSFIGTVNFDGVGFLPDTTGNRRFFTVELTHIDHGYTNLDVNQLWAEAMHLYAAGFDYELLSGEIGVRDESNRDFEREGVYDDKILAHFEITHNAADSVKTDDIIATLFNVENVKDTERALQMEIAKLFTREGLTKKQRPSRWLGVKRQN